MDINATYRALFDHIGKIYSDLKKHVHAARANWASAVNVHSCISKSNSNGVSCNGNTHKEAPAGPAATSASAEPASTAPRTACAEIVAPLPAATGIGFRGRKYAAGCATMFSVF